MTAINHETNGIRSDSSSTNEVDCCPNGEKVVSCTVNTPEGVKLFHLCERHKGISYFTKYSTKVIT